MSRTDINWDLIRDEYIFNKTVSLRGLSRKYDVSPKSVERRCKKEGWVAKRRDLSVEIGQITHARLREEAVAERIKIYEAVRYTLDRLADALQKSSKDADQLFRHLVQYERSNSGIRDRGVEEKVFEMINGRNLADISKALLSIVSVAMTIDGIMDAATSAKLQIEREKLELYRQKAGLSDNSDINTGIAFLPVIDKKLLDDALPDPTQIS